MIWRRIRNHRLRCRLLQVLARLALIVPVLVTAISATTAFTASIVVPPSNATQKAPGVPGAPTITAANSASQSVQVTFTAGSSAYPVLAYQYSTDAGLTWWMADQAASPITITKTSASGGVTPLDNGTEYYVLIRASNTVGEGWSSNLATVMPNVPFISQWRTTTPNQSITLPFTTDGDYNLTVNWGDGTSSTISTNHMSGATHSYAAAGLYNVSVNGQIEGWNCNTNTIPGGSCARLETITQWGGMKFLPNSSRAFANVSGLTSVAADIPDLTSVTNASGFFEGSDFNSAIGDWNVSGITNFSNFFRNNTSFNKSLSSWNVASGTSFANMFEGATSFNGDIASWPIGNATNLAGMFDGVTLPTANYNAILTGWASKNVQANATFGAGSSVYTSSARAAREALTSTNSWTITDGGSLPDPPTSITATGGDGAATLVWSVPSYTGYLANGSVAPISSYTVRSIQGNQTCTTSTTSCTVSGLTNGQQYSFTVTATNSAGTSPASSASNPVTPQEVRVTITSITPGNQQLSVNFTSTIPGVQTYQYSTDGGNTWRNREGGTTESPVVIYTHSPGTTNLANGQSYNVVLRAITHTHQFIGSGGVEVDYTDNGVAYHSHTFLAGGQFVLNTAAILDLLVVGGGGSGGSNGGGGGGAGGVVVGSSMIWQAGNIAVGVGAGGLITPMNKSGSDGADSTFGPYTAEGGGGGGGALGSGRPGGSGGGVSGTNVNSGTGIQDLLNTPLIYGNNGGLGHPFHALGGGGGGGAGAPGGNSPVNCAGGNGGVGMSVDYRTGVDVYYGGGGGGGSASGCAGGAGGSGGGGAGGYDGSGVSGGSANTGGGGGGGGRAGVANGKGGGSGIVVVRYPSSVTPVNSNLVAGIPSQ